MKALRRVSRWLAAALALGYFGWMWHAGQLPEYAHFNAYEAAGLLREPAESVTQVELRSPNSRYGARLAGGQWVSEAALALPPAIAVQLTAAVRFMHTAAPVRVLADSEFDADDLAQFGLAPAALTVTLANASGTLLQFELGLHNPDGILRYLRAAGEPRIVLVSGFVGHAWDDLAAALLVRGASGGL